MDKDFKDKFPQAKSFEDFRREISIIELATAHGYVHEFRKGLRTPVFYNPEYQDRIIIMDPRNVANQGYWNPEDDTDKGTLINFVKRRLGTIFPRQAHSSDVANVNRVLYQYLRLDPFVRQRNRQQVNFETLENLETADFSLANYKLLPLLQTGFFTSRYIDLETLKLPEFSGKIFNVQHLDPNKPGPRYTNTAFPFYGAADNKIVGLEIRNIKFKGHAEGSDRSRGVWHSNMPAKLERIVMVESALDALAYQEFKKQTNNLYVSYGGNLTLNQIQTIKNLKARGNPARNFHFVISSDNDKKGAYYDLMFIRELAAERLPSQRLANTKGYIRLAFSSAPQSNPAAPGTGDLALVAETLIEKLKPYPEKLVEEKRKGKRAAPVKPNPVPDPVNVRLEEDRLLVEIPNNFSALNTFNHKFIQAAGLDHEIRIDKALLNDHNEDLMLIKLINKDPKLLAELNQKDLRRGPAQALSYLDLKFVMLQPGRYEQIGRIFQLTRMKEDGNPVLKFGS
jgi:hypothetical protein